ncbi:MAG: hypothetical protein ACI9OJ_000078 [Myxococcota bacterium]|jgi:hypothetical protein
MSSTQRPLPGRTELKTETQREYVHRQNQRRGGPAISTITRPGEDRHAALRIYPGGVAPVRGSIRLSGGRPQQLAIEYSVYRKSASLRRDKRFARRSNPSLFNTDDHSLVEAQFLLHRVLLPEVVVMGPPRHCHLQSGDCAPISALLDPPGHVCTRVEWSIHSGTNAGTRPANTPVPFVHPATARCPSVVREADEEREDYRGGTSPVAEERPAAIKWIRCRVISGFG